MRPLRSFFPLLTPSIPLHPPPHTRRNVWACKTRHTSIFSHGLFDNPVTLFGVCIELLIMVVVVFVPGLQSIMFTAPLPGAVWACHLLFLAYLLAMTEWVKATTRREPAGWVARSLAY